MAKKPAFDSAASTKSGSERSLLVGKPSVPSNASSHTLGSSSLEMLSVALKLDSVVMLAQSQQSAHSGEGEGEGKREG